MSYPIERFFCLTDTHPKPRIGVSACLCGDQVRYDGRDKAQPGLIRQLAPFVRLEKVCPEVAVGMGVPRAPIHLKGGPGRIEAVAVADPSQRYTGALRRYADQFMDQQLHEKNRAPLCGFLFKSRSPSCGVGSTPVYYPDEASGLADGIFAGQIHSRWPWLPRTEEARLNSRQEMEAFLLQIQLLYDFCLSLQQDKSGTGFHRHHAPLLSRLPAPISERLEQQARQLATQQAGVALWLSYYFTDLVQALEQ